MFEINGKTYTLKYSIGRMKLIEQAAGTPIMASLYKDSGMLSISNLILYLAYALLGEDGVYCPLKYANEFAEKYIEEKGYAAANALVLETMQRDCPFFFRAG